MSFKIVEEANEYDDVEAVLKRKPIQKDGKKTYVRVPDKYHGQKATVAIHEETGGWAGGQMKAMQRMGIIPKKRRSKK